jgi:photosystem II stability/assembly factor-like uncharacterized protein
MFKLPILCASVIVMAVGCSIIPPGPPGSPSPPATGPQPLFCSKGGTWKQIGPAPLTVSGGTNSGEVLGIAIDPRGSSDSTIYVATNGGIWKTTDGGVNWDTRTDCLANVRMGAVALDAGNPSVVYAGTGNLFSAGGATLPIPTIVYKSYDGGFSWWPLSLPSTSTYTIRMVSPAAKQLLVGTENGLFRSTDGGESFHSVLTGGAISDLKVDTANSSTIYAAVGGVGILQSNDGGETFPTNLFNNPGAPPPANTGFILLSQSTLPNNQTIYASVERGGGYLGLYKSSTRGTSWQLLPQAAAVARDGCACFYTHTIGVDPKDSNRVYLGFTKLYVSPDGGQTWSRTGNLHDDFHALVFSPPSHPSGTGLGILFGRTPFYAGEDGGIAKTNDGMNFTDMNGTAPHGIATNLFGPPIDIGRGPAMNNQFIYGGMQDTGTGVHRPDLPALEWDDNAGGDGNQVAVNRSDPAKAYGATGGAYMTTIDGGRTWPNSPSASSHLPDYKGISSGRPILVDPTDPNNVYVISSPDHLKLFQSRDGGKTFGTTSTPTPINTFSAGVNANSTSMVAIDNNTMWVALDSGKVAVSRNVLTNLPTWTELTVPGAPVNPDSVNGTITPAAVAIDPADTRRVVVVYGGFSKIDALLWPTQHVFMTADGGSHWRDISGVPNGGIDNLPDRPLTAVAINEKTSPHAIVVAGLGGVFESLNAGESWHALGRGLPNVLVTSIALDTSVDPPLLFAATWGRSVFSMELKLANPPPPRPQPPSGGSVDNGCGAPKFPIIGGFGNGGKGDLCEFRGPSGTHVSDGILVCGAGGNLICCPIGTTGPGCGPGAPPLPRPGSPP